MEAISLFTRLCQTKNFAISVSCLPPASRSSLISSLHALLFDDDRGVLHPSKAFRRFVYQSALALGDIVKEDLREIGVKELGVPLWERLVEKTVGHRGNGSR
eukprot:1375149-Amorphochlora_amoeboformis.AAC.1